MSSISNVPISMFQIANNKECWYYKQGMVSITWRLFYRFLKRAIDVAPLDTLHQKHSLMYVIYCSFFVNGLTVALTAIIQKIVFQSS
jgi:hypothetical protein